MKLISLKNINLSFSKQIILNNVNLNISKGQKICLIGRNGVGKSTLLKIIESKIKPDNGEVIKHYNTIISSMVQEIPNNIEGNIMEIILGGLDILGNYLIRYQKKLRSDLESNTIEELHNYIDENNGWGYINDAEVLISKLNLNHMELFKNLSGGMKRKVILARSLIKKPDLLLLDEPTNHFDIDSINWLEEFLISFNGAILFITHDRKFLKSVATSILELDKGNLYHFNGSYSKFIKKKEQICSIQERTNIEFDKKLAKEETWIRKGIKARRTRNEGRVKALELMRQERKQRYKNIGKVDLSISNIETSSKKIIQANNISFQYNNKFLFKNFFIEIIKGDKIAIIGKNGCGKTTLLNCLLGIIKPSNGLITLSKNIKFSYFDQFRNQLDEKLNIIDNIKEGSDFINFNGKEINIITYLKKFLFTPEKLRLPITYLSGGEKNRLLLAKILSKPSNIIIFDEPTNDLDIETLEILEEMLINFKGTIIIVSHDREFINNVVTSTIVFDDANLKEFIGGYDEWLLQRKKNQTIINQKSQSNSKICHEQKKQLRNLPNQIEKLEQKITSIQKKISQSDFYKKSLKEIKQFKKELKTLNSDLELKYLLWEKLLNLK